MATAIVTQRPWGNHLRLSNRGFQFGSHRLNGDNPIEAAEQILASEGFKTVSPWDQIKDSEWVAEIDLAEGE